jgi:hypothetical protein
MLNSIDLCTAPELHLLADISGIRLNLWNSWISFAVNGIYGCREKIAGIKQLVRMNFSPTFTSFGLYIHSNCQTKACRQLQGVTERYKTFLR